jgi:murein tripeptide amidase MpaA
VSSTGLFVLLLVVAIHALVRPADYKRFDNHKLVLMKVSQPEDYYFLENQYHNNQSLDFWIEPRIGDVVVRLPPEVYDSFVDVIGKRGIPYEKINDNIQEQLDEQWNEIEGRVDAFSLTQYNTLADIMGWIENLPSTHAAPGLSIQPFIIGNSYHGRRLQAVRISSTTGGTKNTVMFDGGIHAREWISPATVLWMTNQLLVDYANGVSQIVNLFNRLNIIILPVFNPDGYEYTWTNDRLWRKTRRPNSGSSCIGTDPNRNWNDHWGQAGTSTNPCAETYGGTGPNSERCVLQVSDYLLSLPRCTGYINFHAYSQLWLSPYGWTSARPADYNAQMSVGNSAAAALRAPYGTSYTVGPIYTTIYPASGSSADFAYTSGGITYAYAPELRPTSNSQYGFQLPANQIAPSGQETYQALKVWLQACADA